jgi:hypothetical protein
MQFCTKFGFNDNLITIFFYIVFGLIVSLICIFLGNLPYLKFQVITEAIPDTVGSKLIGLVTTRAEIPELLKVKLISGL